MRGTWMVVLALLVGPGALVAQGRGPDRDRRESLERQVREQFMERIADRLELTDAQRERVGEALAGSAAARRELAAESRSLRTELMQAVRADDAPMSRFREILDRLEAVREREREIERQEEAALAEILDPRQRVVFLMMRMQLNDRIRRMRGMMPGGPGGPSGGPPGHPPLRL